MVFNSFEFFAFLALVMLVYGFVRAEWRWIVLLLFSLAFFLSFGIKGLFFVLFTTASTYLCAIKIIQMNEDAGTPYRRLLLAVGLVANFGILAVLKYFNFFAGSAAALFSAGFTPLQLIVPVGISFYTFQMMGYLIDVYRGTVKPQQNFFKLLLFAAYFPQVLDGPISRYADVAPALYSPKDIDYARCRDALVLFAWGLFKKICVADNIKIYVDMIFGDYQSYRGLLILSGGIAYAIYIYADFSGCIDMVRGMSAYFGIELKQNFERPYFSTSVEEFWRRWHITLSSWFRDYLFYPLQRTEWLKGMGRRLKQGGHKKAARAVPTVIATMIVWLTTGLWHGANTTFIAWGLYFGIFISFSVVRNTFFKKKPLPANADGQKRWLGTALRMTRTFLIVCIGYLIFNSVYLPDAWNMIKNMLDIRHFVQLSSIYQTGVTFYKQVGGALYFAVTVLSTTVLIGYDILEECGISVGSWLQKRSTAVKYAVSVAAVFFLLFMMNRSSGDFTYMQF